MYELVAVDASEWLTLYFSMYHPRRSRKVPEGYSRISWSSLNELIRVHVKINAFGINRRVNNFPLDLPEAIKANQQLNDIMPDFSITMARKVEEILSKQKGKWNTPQKK